jgi:hypothetical protein
MTKKTSSLGYRSAPFLQPDVPLALDCVSATAQCLLAQPADAAISEIMEHLGRALNADRCWMFEYGEDLARFHNTHEWCARGISSHVEDLQDAPVSMIAWLHRRLLLEQAVMINDVTALPNAARVLRREMLRQDDKSVLSVPIFHRRRLRACIGFDAVRARREWTDAEAAILVLCGRLIAQARYGNMSSRGGAARKEASAPLVYLGSTNGRIRGVPLRMIVAIQSKRNETQLWLDDGSCEIDRRPLHAWRTLLPLARFPSIHRTAIVNLSHIAALDKHGGAGFHWQLQMRGIDAKWPVSRQYRKELVERLGW